LLIARGRHLDIVTQAETLDAFLPLRENLERLGIAYYLAELVDQFLAENVENPALFDLLLHALRWLGEAATDPVLLARFFELQLLKYVGYQPQLFKCVNCGKTVEPIDNFFSADIGGILDPDCVETQREKLAGRGRDVQPISLNGLKMLRYLQTREWVTVSGVRLTAGVLTEVELLMRRYIMHHLERNLKSVDFLNTLRQPVIV
jgi:DNA repair protein RecO (recombination protein O)